MLRDRQLVVPAAALPVVSEYADGSTNQGPGRVPAATLPVKANSCGVQGVVPAILTDCDVVHGTILWRRYQPLPAQVPIVVGFEPRVDSVTGGTVHSATHL